MDRISESDEAILKAQTQHLYNTGGADNVMACVYTMQRCQLIILQKLKEILEARNVPR